MNGLAAWAAVVGVAAACAHAAPARFLAADSSLHARLEDAELTLGQARYVGRVLALDQPWEARDFPLGLGYLGSVLIDDQGRWRLYYELMKSNAERCAAVAFSRDGVRWTKPKLNLTGDRYTAAPNNLIHVVGTKHFRGSVVFRDPRAPADQRYKLSWRLGHRMSAAVSPDGFTFRNVGTVDAAGKLDSLNVTFRDPMTGKYTAFLRWWFGRDIPRPERYTRVPPMRRGVSMKTSERWDGDWTGRRRIVVDPKDLPGETGLTDLYTPGVQPYHGQYIGLPAIYFRRPIRNNTETAGPIYPAFMHSRDGIRWRFPNHRHPVIDLKAHGQDRRSFGQAYPAGNLLERDGTLWIYYAYVPTQHHQPRDPKQAAYHLARLRVDGFGAVASRRRRVGRWTTPPIRVPAKAQELRLNAKAPGAVRVELLGERGGQPLPGFELANAVPIQGDHPSAQAQWRAANLAALAGRNVRLRFELRDAAVFSFRFAAADGKDPDGDSDED